MGQSKRITGSIYTLAIIPDIRIDRQRILLYSRPTYRVLRGISIGNARTCIYADQYGRRNAAAEGKERKN